MLQAKCSKRVDFGNTFDAATAEVILVDAAAAHQPIQRSPLVETSCSDSR